MQTALSFSSIPEITDHALARSGGVEAIVARFEQWMETTDSPIRAIREQPARDGEFRDIPECVHPDVRRALGELGIPRLYTHQAEAFDLCAAGKNVVVVTPTASGKTLCYNLPVLDCLLRDPSVRAMYLFPTKALAEDQLHEFQSAADTLGSGIRAFTFDA